MAKAIVTGLGAISCAGNNMDEFWNELNQPSGIRRQWPMSPVLMPDNVDSRAARRMDRYTLMTLSASKIAMDMRFGSDGTWDETRVGTVFTTGYGPIESNIAFSRQLQSGGADMVSPTVFTSTSYNSCVGNTCLHLGLKGASTLLMGSHAIAYAGQLLESGKADVILCGGVDAYCDELQRDWMQLTGAADEPDRLCRPFDTNRGGAMMSEGAGVLILENETALERHPDQCFCAIVGYATVPSPAYPLRNPEGADYSQLFAKVMNRTLNHAGLAADDIDGILMAASGDMTVDKAEADAIHAVFGDKATSIPVTSIKGAIGEPFGASFSLNAVAAALAINKKQMPLTAGCQEPDADLKLDIVIGKPRPGNYRHLMANGFDVSGNLYSAIFTSVSEVRH